MFHRTLLDRQLSPQFSTPFPTVVLGSSTSPSLLYPSMSPSTATLQRGLSFGRLAEQPPLTRFEPTPITLPSREGSLDTNVDDLATIEDASDVYDTADVGRLTSPLFSQEHEVSADPFSVSCSQRHSSVEKSMRDVELFSSFGNRCRKVKEIEIRSVCKILK